MRKYLILLIFLCCSTLVIDGQHLCRINVASWNIGHFALGKKSDTKVSYAESEARKKAYRKLFNQVDADILCLLEYNPNFVNATDSTPAVIARDAILSNYRDAEIGNKYKYNCNAVFSNGIKILKTEEVMFKVMVQTRYYLVVTALLDGDVIKIVSTHLDW